MTGQHRKPSPEKPTFLVRPVDADRVREAIAGVAAKAINEAAETIRKVREWCDTTESETREWMTQHNAECECEVGETYLNAVDQVRSLLPPVPEAAEGVEK